MKIVSLLSLLLLWSSNCFASSGMVPMFGLEIIIVPLALLFIVNLLLLLCFSRFLLKNKEIKLSTLAGASFLNTLLWGTINFLLLASGHAPRSSILLPSLLSCAIIIVLALCMIALAMPLYAWLFPTIDKRQRLFMILFVYLLNPLQWLLNSATAVSLEEKFARSSRVELHEKAPGQESSI